VKNTPWAVGKKQLAMEILPIANLTYGNVLANL
jgi:hypothetical protein